MTVHKNIQNLLSLEGKKALITGATKGIGLAIARCFSQAGARVIVHGREKTSELEKLCDGLRKPQEKLALIAADLSNPNECEKLIYRTEKEYGPIQILVNNAASQISNNVRETSNSDINQLLLVNLNAPFLLTREFAKVAQPGCSILNIASIEGHIPAIGHSHYAATKAGLIQFTKAAALELGSSGIRVNSICPGLVDRPNLSTDWPEGFKSWSQNAPLGSLVNPKDIANGALFLSSNAARLITGSCLTVDAGMTCVPAW